MTLVDDKLRSALRAFNEKGQLGPDPLAARYAERRAAFSLFARQMSEADIDALRPYPELLHGRVPARDPAADPQDAPRGREGLLRGQARLRSPGRGLRGGHQGRDGPRHVRGPALLARRMAPRRARRHRDPDELHL